MLWLRMMRVLVAACFRPRLTLVEQSVLRFRVLPTDLDFNVHMNNARYLALMDLGRLDLIIRTGLWRIVLSQHWQPVLGGCMVRFRRSLKPFQPFELASHMLAWDDKWIYIEHIIAVDGILACQAVVRGAFVAADGVVAPASVAQAAGFAGEAPALPAWVAASVSSWREMEAR
jgi:acyl-CoA thioesterase FadM